MTRLATLCLMLAALVAPAAAASAQDYNDVPLPTQTQLEVTVDGPGEPVILDVSASANSENPPKGEITVRIYSGEGTARAARAVAAAPLFTTRVRFTGTPVRIVGPRLDRGRYIATAAFSPSNRDGFRPSDTVEPFRIGGAVSPAVTGNGGPGSGTGTGLPNTGGPDLLWLLLGAALVAVGAGTIGYGRRGSLTTV